MQPYARRRRQVDRLAVHDKESILIIDLEACDGTAFLVDGDEMDAVRKEQRIAGKLSGHREYTQVLHLPAFRLNFINCDRIVAGIAGEKMFVIIRQFQTDCAVIILIIRRQSGKLLNRHKYSAFRLIRILGYVVAVFMQKIRELSIMGKYQFRLVYAKFHF